MTNNISFSKLELDQLAEVVNIGGGNAATAFSQLLGKDIQMDVPTPFIGHVDEVQRLLGNSDDVIVSVFLKMYGDLTGALAIIFQPDDAIKFAKILSNQTIKDKSELSEQNLSTLKELGNILFGSSINALSKFLNLNILHTIPDVTYDMLGAVMDSVILEMAEKTDQVLCFRINLEIMNKGVKGELYYLFDPLSSEKILNQTKLIMGKV